MSIIIFILLLSVLIFVHELGHFLIAKKSGIRVDEFAIGFPPKIFSFTKGGTKYALNLIPFGGYVKIFGETPDEDATTQNATDSMINKSKLTQASVLVAGIVFNIIFAGIIFLFLFVRGVELNADLVPYVNQDSVVRVEYVMDDSIASKAGLEIGDTVNSVTFADQTITNPQEIMSALYSESKTSTQVSVISDTGEIQSIVLIPEEENSKFGFSLSNSVYIQTNPFTATWYAFLATGHMITLTTVGLFDFFKDIFMGNANFDQVAGPVGIVGLVGQAAQIGLNQVLLLAAVISVNLAIVNLVPFPALDGGRLAIVAIESIRRKDLNYQKVAIINLAGFALLILLMIVLTFNDIKNLFN